VACGRTRRVADLKIVHMSIATYRTASRQAWSRSASQSMTAWAVRRSEIPDEDGEPE
jgi:hypothetical protein